MDGTAGTAVTPEAYPRLHALIRLAEAGMHEVALDSIEVSPYPTGEAASRLVEHEAVVAALSDDDFAAIAGPEATERYEAMCLTADSPQPWQDLDTLISGILC